ncbi:type 1 glutamine amidotransferase domain-containing protein [Roseivirga sp. BDSF3-8]|uniref:type 1 glutamine amidotransferase domain-containing protein n=1 Tax=Roseivirga sp. BDSF3-8 TaxID=3241598 RepID=UPI00353199D9
MSKHKLKDRKIAVLVANGFEQVELTKPVEELKKSGATVHIISPESKTVKGWDKTDWGKTFDVDVHLDSAMPTDYDGLVLPGGQMNPDFLRANDKAVNFTKSFFNQGKPVAAICHGPWLLVETGEIDNRKMTSYNSIQTDLKNAGANWVDEQVVVDRGLITSRNPDDLEAFCEKMIEEFEGVPA